MVKSKKLIDSFFNAILGIMESKEKLNNYNEFPIPDHDAGINAYLTLKPCLKLIEYREKDINEFIKKIEEKLEYSSAGNIGIILHLFIPEFLSLFTKGLLPEPESIKDFSVRMIERIKSVFTWAPEGTPVSLFSYLKEQPEVIFRENFSDIIAHKLNEWKNKLDLQKEKGVPDSGLYALCLFLEKFMKGLKTKEELSDIYEKLKHVEEEKENNMNIYEGDFPIFVDSSADITNELMDIYRVGIIPLQIIISSKRFREGFEINREEVYKEIKLMEKEITTSQPSKFDIEKAIKSLIDRSKEILIITISKGLSGTWNTVKSVADKIGKGKVTVFDSEFVSLALTLFAIRAREKLQKGQKFQDVVNHLIRIREKSFLFFTLRTFENIVKSGRISWAQGKIASFLKMRPIMTLEKGRDINRTGVAFGDKGVMKKIISILKNKLDPSIYYDFGIAHIEREDVVNFFKDKLHKNFKVRKLLVSSLSPVIAIHVGYGAYGIFAIPYYE